MYRLEDRHAPILLGLVLGSTFLDSTVSRDHTDPAIAGKRLIAHMYRFVAYPFKGRYIISRAQAPPCHGGRWGRFLCHEKLLRAAGLCPVTLNSASERSLFPKRNSRNIFRAAQKLTTREI